jgi:hypothetical protein
MSETVVEQTAGPDAEVKMVDGRVILPDGKGGAVFQSDGAPVPRIEDMTSDPQMIAAFNRFGQQAPSIDDMGRFVGFGDKEIELSHIFMTTTFDDSWFYLSPEFIMNDIGYSSTKKFAEVLRSGRVKGIDYDEVSADHELVKAWDNYAHEGAKSPKAPKVGRPGNYYIVRGEVLETMLMRANTEKAESVRKLFVKIKKLALFMHSYISLAHRFISEQQRLIAECDLAKSRVRIAELESQNEGLDERAKLLEQFVKAKSLKNPMGWVYMGTTRLDQLANRHKIGYTDNLHMRLKKYTQTFSNATNRFYFNDYWPVHEPRLVEHLIKMALKPYHLIDNSRTAQDESYICNTNVLHAIVSDICTKYMAIVDDVNHRLDSFRDDVLRPSPIMTRELPAEMLMIEMKGDVVQTFNLITPTTAEQDTVCHHVINKLMHARGHEGFDFAAMPALESKVEIKWLDIRKELRELISHGKKDALPDTLWKEAFRRVFSGSESIIYKCYKTKENKA